MFVFKPVETWTRVVEAKRGFAAVLFLFLLPFLLLTGAVEGYGMAHFGKSQMVLGSLKKFSVAEAAIYEAGNLLLTLGVVLLGAKLIKAMGETFHGRHTFTQAFTAVAYGLSPIFLFRLLDVFPRFSPWISWGIGMALAMAALYQGIPRVMQPDPPHAFGLYLMGAIMLTIITGLSRFVTAWYLEGRFQSLSQAISNLADQLTK